MYGLRIGPGKPGNTPIRDPDLARKTGGDTTVLCVPCVPWGITREISLESPITSFLAGRDRGQKGSFWGKKQAKTGQNQGIPGIDDAENRANILKIQVYTVLKWGFWGQFGWIQTALLGQNRLFCQFSPNRPWVLRRGCGFKSHLSPLFLPKNGWGHNILSYMCPPKSVVQGELDIGESRLRARPIQGVNFRRPSRVGACLLPSRLPPKERDMQRNTS